MNNLTHLNMSIPKPTPDEILSFERYAISYLKQCPTSNPTKALAKLNKVSEELDKRELQDRTTGSQISNE